MQTHLKAEHRKRYANAFMENTAAYRDHGKAKRSTGRRTVERHLLSDRTVHLCRARVGNTSMNMFPLTNDGGTGR